HVVLHETPADERRIGARVRAYHDVVAFGDQIDVAVLGDDLELDIGITLAELRGELPERRVRNLHRCADPQSAARPKGSIDERLPNLRDLREQRMRALVQGSAFLGQSERPRAALEKPHAEAVLERHDLSRQGRLRPSAAAARLAEAAFRRDEIERGEAVDVQRVIHYCNTLSKKTALRTDYWTV